MLFHQMKSSVDGNTNYITGTLCYTLCHHPWHALCHTLSHIICYTLVLPCCHVMYNVTHLVLVSERSPVTLSTAVRNSTPFCSPMFRNSPPMDTGSAGMPMVPSGTPWPISTMQSDSGEAGRACMLSGCRQSCIE